MTDMSNTNEQPLGAPLGSFTGSRVEAKDYGMSCDSCGSKNLDWRYIPFGDDVESQYSCRDCGTVGS